MAVRNTAIAHDQAAANGTRILYTCPPATVVLVKSIMTWSPSVSSSSFMDFYCRTPAGFLVQVFSHNYGTASAFNLETWFALNEGDELVADLGQSAINYWISGATLPLP